MKQLKLYVLLFKECQLKSKLYNLWSISLEISPLKSTYKNLFSEGQKWKYFS